MKHAFIEACTKAKSRGKFRFVTRKFPIDAITVPGYEVFLPSQRLVDSQVTTLVETVTSGVHKI